MGLKAFVHSFFGGQDVAKECAGDEYGGGYGSDVVGTTAESLRSSMFGAKSDLDEMWMMIGVGAVQSVKVHTHTIRLLLSYQLRYNITPIFLFILVKFIPII